MDQGYEFMLECLSFDPTQAPSKEMIDKYYDLCESGISKEEERLLSKIFAKRFDHIIAGNAPGLKTSGTDNDLLLISWKYLGNQICTELAVTIIKAQLETTLYSALKSLGVSVTKDSKDEYMSCVYSVLIEQMPKYDPSKGLLVTFLSPYIKGEVFKTLAVDQDRTTHVALHYRDVCAAFRGLSENGINNPTAKEIADYINDRPHKYKEISARTVSRIMSRCSITSELDENLEASDASPEEAFIAKEEKYEAARDIEKLFDGYTAVHKRIWSLIVEYFDNTDSSSMPTYAYLWEKFNRLYPESSVAMTRFRSYTEGVIQEARKLIDKKNEPEIEEAPWMEITVDQLLGLKPYPELTQELIDEHERFTEKYMIKYEDLGIIDFVVPEDKSQGTQMSLFEELNVAVG